MKKNNFFLILCGFAFIAAAQAQPEAKTGFKHSIQSAGCIHFPIINYFSEAGVKVKREDHSNDPDHWISIESSKNNAQVSVLLGNGVDSCQVTFTETENGPTAGSAKCTGNYYLMGFGHDGDHYNIYIGPCDEKNKNKK